MKKCIWCNRDEKIATFNNRAHTIPQSLGGKHICENVCDDCNAYFGNRASGLPSIEAIFKEFIHLSQYILLLNIQKKIRLKSEFFDVTKQLEVKTKMKYSLRKDFQNKLLRQFKRAIYKVFLEERERQCKDAHDERFNFIREFCRADLGDYPVFYMLPFKGVVLFQTDDVKNPEVRFTIRAEDLDKKFRMFEFMLCGHTLIIPTSTLYQTVFKAFLNSLKYRPVLMGTEMVEIRRIDDIDITFEHLKNN